MNSPILTVQQKPQYDKLIAMVSMLVRDVQPLEEEYLRTAVKSVQMIAAPDLTESHVENALKKLMEQLSVSVELGTLIRSDQFQPWLTGRRDEIEWTRWKAYKLFLAGSGYPLKVLDRLDETTDQILDNAGDPELAGQWARRGLVIGDVQSGKTSTYLGILNKAVDAGYKLIIVLAGSTEQLRQQTQIRVDEGFIGLDSSLEVSLGSASVRSRVIGVGKVDRAVTQTVGMTTALYDFRKKNREVINFTLNEMTRQPHIFVLKKNKTVLEGVTKWLKGQTEGRGSLEIPLFLLDDESDYASVNTKEETDPTAINAAIRGLLSLSTRNSYLAFTATPFANIFIDHAVDDDLFPRDYIFALEAPSNYVGAEKVFAGASADRLLDPADAAVIFPLGHKSSLEVPGLPDSLLDAVRVFVLANAIRDLRGHSGARSMLVNVSRFVRVQNIVFAQLEGAFADIRNSIEFHSASFARGVHNNELERLKEVFAEHYAGYGFDWHAVAAALPAAVRDIRVRVYNAKSDRSMEGRDGAPPRIIAVGGDVLSRGVTLGGLVVSYFYRRAGAADTLMQMARWFGYRDDYEDLCRLWVDPVVADQFRYIHGSVEELRTDLKLMMRQGLTPRDFGLAVRDHPDSLLITARNKMRSAVMESKSVSLNGRSVESTELLLAPNLVASNLEAFADLVSGISETIGDAAWGPGEQRNLLARSVPKHVVATFLAEFRGAPGSIYFGDTTLGRWARNATSAGLQTWDVAVIAGSGDERSFGQISVRTSRRTLLDVGESIARVSGERGRLASAADIEVTLVDAEVSRRVEKEFQSINPTAKGVPESQFMPLLRRPALMIYLIEPGDKSSASVLKILGDRILVAAKVAIPGDRTKRSGLADVRYALNTVAQTLPRIIEVDTEDVDDDDDC